MRRRTGFFAVILSVVFLIILWAGNTAMAVEYAGRLFRDPFGENYVSDPGKTEDARDSLPSLQGVVWSSVKPQALISGKIVKVGDRVGDADVLEIRKDGVKMRDKAKEYYLRFKREAV